MNKKERKANAVLSAAMSELVKKSAERAVKRESSSVRRRVTRKPEPSKAAPVNVKREDKRTWQELVAMRGGEKYVETEIFKEKKGYWKVIVRMFRNSPRATVGRRFKSWVSARQWCLLHTAV